MFLTKFCGCAVSLDASSSQHPHMFVLTDLLNAVMFICFVCLVKISCSGPDKHQYCGVLFITTSILYCLITSRTTILDCFF